MVMMLGKRDVDKGEQGKRVDGDYLWNF